MQKIYLLVVLAILATFGVAQDNYNVELLSNVPLADNEDGNDIWGFVDRNGVEYAVMGTTFGTSIYSLEDPRNPIQRARIRGAKSIWRDIKTYRDRIYVVADQGDDGLLVIDMSRAPETITHEYYQPQVDIGGRRSALVRAHNLFIDEFGRMIITGSNVYSGTPLVFDLARSLDRAPFVGASAQRYAHDVYAYDNLLFTSDIYEGVLTTHDLTDPASIRRLGSAKTSSNFTHNAWATLDNASVFTTDERDGSSVDAFDVSDPTEIKLVDKFRPNEIGNSRSVPHNTHVLGNHLATSWYKDGVILTDATRPNNMVEVGRYDTRPQASGGGFEGCWGAYPFLPSGTLLASDIQAGLFVFKPTYARAGYLEGLVTDAANGLSLGDVKVEFVGDPTISERSNLAGEYATGHATPGAYRVRFSKNGYQDVTIPLTLNAGKLTRRDVKMQLEGVGGLDVRVRSRAPNSVALPNADTAIVLKGQRRVGGELVKVFDVYAGEFGYQTRLLRNIQVAPGKRRTVSVSLNAGYYDDFLFDNEWTVSSTATTGAWELGVAEGTNYDGSVGQPAGDVLFDYGDRAYVTGRTAGASVGSNDVDDGSTTLTSPEIDLNGLPDARIEFSYFFYNDGGNGSTPNDELTVELRSASETVNLLTVEETTNGWQRFESGPLSDLIDLSGPLRLEITTGDDSANGHLVEAGFDWFVVTPVARPNVSFSPQSGCAPLQVSANFAADEGAQFVLAVPDSALGIQTAASSQTVTSAGVFDAVVEVPDGRGGLARFVYPNAVDVEEPTVAQFETFINGDTVYFENISSNITGASWNFGDGTTGEGLFVSHVFSDTKVAFVTLNVDGPCGKDRITKMLDLEQATGTRSHETRPLLTVSQNPVQDQLYVGYAGTEDARLLLRNGLGQTVAEQKARPSQTLDFPVGSLPVGVYFLHVADSPEPAVQVLITR